MRVDDMSQISVSYGTSQISVSYDMSQSLSLMTFSDLCPFPRRACVRASRRHVCVAVGPDDKRACKGDSLQSLRHACQSSGVRTCVCRVVDKVRPAWAKRQNTDGTISPSGVRQQRARASEGRDGKLGAKPRSAERESAGADHETQSCQQLCLRFLPNGLKSHAPFFQIWPKQRAREHVRGQHMQGCRGK